MPWTASRSVGARASLPRRALALVSAGILVVAASSVASAAPVLSAEASVQPIVQYLDDSAGTTFTFTIENSGDVGIGAVEISRPSNSWTVLACPMAPTGWSTQQADTKCRYRSAETPADDLAAHTESSDFQVTASVVAGSQNIVGTWSVTVSSSNQFDKKSKVKSAAIEPPGLTTTAFTFQILDAVVVTSALTPGSPCPAPTPANHSAGTGATGQTIAICGRNRANLALAPVPGQAVLGGTFIASSGTFSSGSIAADSAASVVLGNWSDVTITGTSGPNKTIDAKVGSAANRTSPLATLTGYTAIDDAPFVISTTPADGADHVAVDTNITVTFSEPVAVTASSFSLECPTGAPLAFGISGAPGVAITLDPTADLPEGTICTVIAIANQISDTDTLDPPDNPTTDHQIWFTTDSAPGVTGTTPADGAIAVDPASSITIQFSEPVNAGTSAFTLECPAGNPKGFSVGGSGTSTITLDPTVDLPPTTACVVTAIASEITDVDGGDPPDHPAVNHVFDFTTVDDAPSVTGTTPANGAIQVVSNTDITVDFSESVGYTTGSFDLECASVTQPFTLTTASPGMSATLDPSSDLPNGGSCTLTVFAVQISDSDAVDPPDHMASDFSSSFTVDAAPSVTNTTPADGATGVDPSVDITVDFSEAVDANTTSFTISCDGNPQTFTVAGSGSASITLDPSSDLPSTAICTVTALAANISDTDTADPPDHPDANASFSFTTVDGAPSVSNTSPSDGALGVSRTVNIDITFSEAVTATGGSFTLECPTGSAQAFAVSGSPGSTITLDPNADLPLGETCTVTVVAAQISDADAVDPPDTMTANYVFTFTVATNLPPTDISLSNTSVDENEPFATTVGTLSTTDPDVGDTFTYSLVAGTGDTDNASFQITGDQLQTNAVFDFETKSSYSIRVRSTDSGSATFEKEFTITIDDVNEAPTDIALSNSSIDENEPSGTTIGGLTATDPDLGQTHSFSLESSGCGGSFPDNASFSISGTDLQSAVIFNHEVKDSYTVCIRTTDSGAPSLSFDEQFTISIVDVNDAPVANPDSYTGAIGNTHAVLGTAGTGPHVVLTGNVLSNNDTDEDVPAQTLTATAETVASTGGGTATINADGSFTFLPGVGDKNQDDTFTYQLGDGLATSVGTVTVHIDDFLVWYVDNASAGPTFEGRSNAPFLDLSSLDGPGGAGDSDGSGDTVFVYQGSGSYGGGIPLEVDQSLFGQKAGLTVNGHLLVTAGSTAPVITNAGGVGVGLAGGVDVQGVDISGTSGDAINGTAVTTATVGTTTAVNISGAGGDGVDLSGAASGNISIAAPITGSAGHSVTVANRIGGTTTFNGAISDTGTGISLVSNTSATISFTGGIMASTGANTAFSATGGGTVNVTGSANTLATTTARALNVTNTTIGASGLTFRSISSNGAVNGIVLDTTGSSGGLTVTGNSAGTCGTLATEADCTGGTIQNSTGDGVLLNSTTNPSFTRLNVKSNDGSGIRATGVSGLTVSGSLIQGNADTAGQTEAGLFMANVSGTSALASSTIKGSFENNVQWNASSGSGTVNVTNTKIGPTGVDGTTGNSGIQMIGTGTGAATLTVTGSTFASNNATGIGTSFADTSAHTVNVSTSTFTDNNIAVALGVTEDADATFDVNGNTMLRSKTNAIQVLAGATSTAAAHVIGHIRNNAIGDTTADSGARDLIGIAIEFNDDADGVISVSNNNIRHTDQEGIFVQARDPNTGDSNAANATLDLHVLNNTISSIDDNTAFPFGFVYGMRLESRHVTDVCLDISGNSSANVGAAEQIRVRQRDTSVFRLERFAGNGAVDTDVEGFLIVQNPALATADATHATQFTGVANGACRDVP